MNTNWKWCSVTAACVVVAIAGTWIVVGKPGASSNQQGGKEGDSEDDGKGDTKGDSKGDPKGGEKSDTVKVVVAHSKTLISALADYRSSNALGKIIFDADLKTASG